MAYDTAQGHGLGQDSRAPAIATAPHNLEVEQALLGVLLYDNAAYERLTDSLQGRHFYEPFHARLYDAIETCIRKGQAAEPMLLADGFKGDPAYDELGGLRYLADLVERAPPAVNAPDYARSVLDLAMRRELIRVGGEMVQGAATGSDTARELIEAAEETLFGLAEDKAQGGGFAPFSDALDGFLEVAAQAMNRGGAVTGLSTGLIDLDAKLGGLHPSDLIVLAGRPSMGKTALATNIAFHVAKNFRGEQQPDGSIKAVTGGRVAFFSLEMAKEQLAGRIIADAAGVSSDRIRKGHIDRDEFMRMRECSALLRKIPLHIDDGGGTSIAKITARARRLKRKQGLDLIVVDYLQLAVGTAKTGSNRVAEVGEITGGLKALAKDLGVPVIALSQLSRKVEERDDKRPQLSDLRESGSIEQDADAVMFVYREAYYVGRAEPKEGSAEHMAWQDDIARCQHEADVIIAKQRHGPIGTVKLSFNGDTTRFGNLARESSYESGARLPYGGDE